MKTPGILYRISFLIILNSLFIFAAVSMVSLDNTQGKVDRLIRYRFDFVSDYFRAELEEAKSNQPAGSSAALVGSPQLDEFFRRSSKFMRGLGGLTIISYDPGQKGYFVSASCLRDELQAVRTDIVGRVVADIDAENLKNQRIHIGPKFKTSAGDVRTIYIPWEKSGNDPVLAISFLPEEVFGILSSYNYTLVVLFLIITLISLLIVNLLFRDFVRPLQHLMMGMEKTAEGEVLYQIPDVRYDEIGRVAAAFNSMSASLWEQRRQLTDSNRSLTAALNNLSSANRSLEESQSFLSKLIKHSPFSVIVAHPTGKILLFNHSAAQTFELDQKEAEGKDIRDFFPFAPDKVIPGPAESAARMQQEMICRKKSGEHFPALVSRVVIRDEEGTLTAFLFILRDISESKSFQEMMVSIDRMATRGVMAGEIAHEINNYLAIILGNVELLPLLLAKGDMEKVEHKLTVLRQTVGKIQRFSEGLMGYGNDEAVFRKEDLNQVVENLVAFLRPQNRYDNINLNLSLSTNIPLVEFDSSQIQQMLVNLLNNAADALRDQTGEGAIDIATDLTEDGRSVTITIADNAGGLPDDIHDVIFKSRYTGQRRGRGFGLIIVKRIVDKHGGQIRYESNRGRGTTYFITLPAKSETPVAGDSPTKAMQVTS